MTVITEKDRRTGKELTLVEGVVKGVYLNKLKEVKSYTNAKSGTVWTPTHSVNIIVEDTRVGLGLTDREPPLRAKDINDKYQDLIVGATVSIEINTVGEYNGKPQYSSTVSNVLITAPSTETSGGSNTDGQVVAGGGSKFDLEGTQAGHALNAAEYLLSYKPKDRGELLDYAKQLHAISVSVEEQWAIENPNMPKRSVGGSAGNAVHAACKELTKTKIDEVEALALSTLREVSAPLLTHIKGESTPTKAPKQQDAPPRVEDGQQDLFDDDLPF